MRCLKLVEPAIPTVSNYLVRTRENTKFDG